MKILIVEDDRHLNRAICEMLKNIAEITVYMTGKKPCSSVNKIYMI